MKDLIILAGAPGSGKSTIANLLQIELESPYIDFGWLREWHLKRDWSNQSQEEEDMAFENLLYIIKNYIAHGYKNILVTDLKDEKVQKLLKTFADRKVLLVSLILNSDKELAKRVLGERDGGFKNTEASLRWNRELKEREVLSNELRIDNTNLTPQEAANRIIRELKSS